MAKAVVSKVYLSSFILLTSVAPWQAQATDAGKTFGIYAGFGFIPRAATAIGATLHLGPQFQLDGEFAFGQYSIGDVSSKRSLYTLRARHFPFPDGTFNIALGAAYDVLTYDSSNSSYKYAYTGKKTEVELSIGNRWHPGSMTIGVDWFGYGLRAKQISDTETSEDTNGSSSGDISDARGYAHSSSHSDSVQFLRLELGIAF